MKKFRLQRSHAPRSHLQSPLNEAERSTFNFLCYLIDYIENPLCPDPNDNYAVLLFIAKLYTWLIPSSPFSINNKLIACVFNIPVSDFETLNFTRVIKHFSDTYQLNGHRRAQKTIIDVLDIYSTTLIKNKSIKWLSLLMQQQSDERYTFFTHNLTVFKALCEHFNRTSDCSVWSYPFFIMLLFPDSDRKKLFSSEFNFLHDNYADLASRHADHDETALFFLELIPELAEKLSEPSLLRSTNLFAIAYPIQNSDETRVAYARPVV